MLDKGKHFLLLTVSTLIMAIGTYFFKFTITLPSAVSPVLLFLLQRQDL